MSASYPGLSGIETRPSAKILLHRVYKLYAQSYWRWFRITAPASLTAAFALLLTSQKANELFRMLPQGPAVVHHIPELLEQTLIRFGGFFFAWLTGCLALGAIATILHSQDAEEDLSGLSDSFVRVRQLMLPVSVVATLTFALFIVGIGAGSVAGFAAGKIAGPKYFYRAVFYSSELFYFLELAVLSWFGPSIPLIIRDRIGAWRALKGSLRLSDGYEGFLFLLTVESVVGTYLANFVVRYAAGVVESRLPDSWLEVMPWIVYFSVALASAAVQPPMFIGFSLLADNEFLEEEVWRPL